ncbi:hypothetical protein D3C80_1152230 [compost metagenome]
MHALSQRLQRAIDVALTPLAGEGAQIFCSAKPTGNDQSVQFISIRLRERQDIASGNTGGFDEYITRFRHRFTRQMVNHIHLIFIRRKANGFCALFSQRKQRQNGFVDLCTVVNAAPTQHYTHFFHLAVPSLQPSEAY